MRKAVFLTVMAVFCFWATFAVAQTVKVLKDQGGTLGHIAVGCGHLVTDWNELRAYNLNLPSPVQVRRGVWDVRVFNGDSIFVPDDWDCSKLNSGLAVVTSLPRPEEKISTAPGGTGSEPRIEPARSLWWFQTGVPFGITLMVIVGLLVLLLWYLLARRNRQFGEPVVPGGIRQDELQRIEERFKRIAERRYGEVNPSADLSAERPERISSIESGFLNGHGRVQYRNRTVERRLENEPGYRARFRFPDGSEQELYFLQACGNDVMAGTRYHGFRFSASRTVVPISAPPKPEVVPVVGPEPATVAETPVVSMNPVISQNHQGFVTIRIFDDSGKILMEIDGENPSIEVERGPQGTKVSRRG